jgi:hypothetical protein
MMFREEAAIKSQNNATQPDPRAMPKKACVLDRIGLHARPSVGIIKPDSLLVSECRA